jgi:hypothetical protein
MALPFGVMELEQARQNLKGAFRDQPLVDKFTAIRNLTIPFGSPNVGGTLSAGDIQILKSLRARSSPNLQVTPRVQASTYGGGTRAEMIFTTRFKSRVNPGPPNRVIRFVRAAQVNRLMVWTKDEYTVPGYVHYDPGLQPKSKTDPTPKYIQDALVRAFGQAQWAFDGPREEFKGGALANEDTPGTMSSDLPYGITAEFLIALYDETARKILEVGHKQATLAVWKDKSTSFVLGPPSMLQLPAVQ